MCSRTISPRGETSGVHREERQREWYGEGDGTGRKVREGERVPHERNENGATSLSFSFPLLPFPSDEPRWKQRGESDKDGRTE